MSLDLLCLTRRTAINAVVDEYCNGSIRALHTQALLYDIKLPQLYKLVRHGKAVSFKNDSIINHAVARWLQSKAIYTGAARAFLDFMDVDKARADLAPAIAWIQSSPPTIMTGGKETATKTP